MSDHRQSCGADSPTRGAGGDGKPGGAAGVEKFQVSSTEARRWSQKEENMRRKLTLCLFALSFVLVGTPEVLSGSGGFATISYPGAISTWAWEINERGDIVGQYTDSSGVTHGFLLRGGRFVTVDFPGASRTVAQGINSRGAISGAYIGADGKWHGFVLREGAFTTVDFPGAAITLAYTLNDRGDIPGMYMSPDDAWTHYGFLAFSYGGGFLTLDYPAPYGMACAFGINNSGSVVGHIEEPDGAYRGYVWKDGVFTMIDFPGATLSQLYDGVTGINSAGDMVGNYTDNATKQTGYFLRGGRFTTLDVPGSTRTRVLGVNDRHEVVGMYTDTNGVPRGFLTRVSPAAR
jgi:probable HAF family extracellular repeat protein